MYKALLFLLAHVAYLTAVEAAKGKLTATNGGIIQQGETLTLSYVVEKKWNNCIWYRYEKNEGSEYCQFTAGQEEPSCDPPTLKDHVKFNAVNNVTCSIKVDNVDDSDNVTWSVRVDAQRTNTEINVMVAVQAKNITFEAEPLVAGKLGNISCLISGGRPAPNVSYNFEDIPGLSSPEVNSFTAQTIDDEGIYTTENVVQIKPTAKDHNRVFSCKAVQKAEDKELFEPVEAKTKLNVTFPPLPREDGQGTQKNPMVFGTEVGKDLEIVVKFFANPRPDSVEWKFNKKEDAEGEDSNGTFPVIPAGTSNYHYVASDLADDPEKEDWYVAKLTIKKLQEADHEIGHELVVRNNVGVQVYYYTVELGKITTTTTTTTTTAKPSTTTKPSGGKDSGKGAIYAIVVVCIVLVSVAIGVILFRKWKRSRTETAPLRQTN